MHLWGEERCVQRFVGKTRAKETTWKPGIDRSAILKWILIEWKGVDWIVLAQDRDQY